MRREEMLGQWAIEAIQEGQQKYEVLNIFFQKISFSYIYGNKIVFLCVYYATWVKNPRQVSRGLKIPWN